MALAPQKFRDRPRITSIEDGDIFPLSRMSGGTATTYSIAWSDMSAQIVAEVAEARQEMVDGFTAQQAWMVSELATKATPADITAAINSLVAGAPAALDTLLEIANRLASDESAVTALTGTLAGKEPGISAGTTAQYWRGDKSWQTLNKDAVGLGSVDNTADTAKPVSTAQQTAINGRVGAYGANGAPLSTPKMFVATAVLTAAGTVTLYLTDTGAVGGNALFSTILRIDCGVYDSTTVYAFNPVVSNANKTLTIAVSKAATPLLSLLGLNILAQPSAAPIGTSVNVTVVGY